MASRIIAPKLDSLGKPHDVTDGCNIWETSVAGRMIFTIQSETHPHLIIQGLWNPSAISGTEVLTRNNLLRTLKRMENQEATKA
jgi:hypothetical protein